MIVATCHHCRRQLPASHPWLRIERGVVLPDGQTIPADRNYCCPACWAAATTQEPAS